MQSILNAYRKQIQICNPHDLSFSWYILFLFYAFSVISSCTTKNITPNHTDSHLLPIYKCCMTFVMLIRNTLHWLQCIFGIVLSHPKLLCQACYVSSELFKCPWFWSVHFRLEQTPHTEIKWVKVRRPCWPIPTPDGHVGYNFISKQSIQVTHVAI